MGDEPVRAGVQLALESGGFVVCAAEATGPSAVAAAVRERPDICLLDVQIRGGGISAAAEIASRLPHTAVVMLTASQAPADVLEALSAGARGYLLLDIGADRLPAALRAVVAGEVALPRALVGVVVEELRRTRGTPLAPARRTAAHLTSREWEVLQLLRQGLVTSEIGARLFIADVTVRRHVGRVLRKLGVSSRAEAVGAAGGTIPRDEVHES